MKLFQVVAESIGEVGFGVIKNSGRMIYGGGQAIVGMVTENDELVENGVKNLGRGTFGLSIGLVQKVITGNNSEDENQDIDVDSM
jgi:hypothetical protein